MLKRLREWLFEEEQYKQCEHDWELIRSYGDTGGDYERHYKCKKCGKREVKTL